MSVSDLLTKDYEQMDTWSIRKNEPKTNPNEPKTNPILANKTTIRTQFKPKQTQLKANSNPNKPNSNPIYLVVASGQAGTNPILARHQYSGANTKKCVRMPQKY